MCVVYGEEAAVLEREIVVSIDQWCRVIGTRRVVVPGDVVVSLLGVVERNVSGGTRFNGIDRSG